MEGRVSSNHWVFALLLTSFFEDFFVARLGVGLSSFNDSIILLISSLIVICGILLSRKETIKKMPPKVLFEGIEKGTAKVVSTSAPVLFAYFVSNVFEDLKVEVAISEFIQSFNMPRIVICLIILLFMAILGMLLHSSTQVKYSEVLLSLFLRVQVVTLC